MIDYTLIGVDPGLKHTGLVAIHLDTGNRAFHREHLAVVGLDLDKTADWITNKIHPGRTTRVFIEQYIDRGTNFVQNKPMREFELQLKASVLNAKLVNNTGSKAVITREMAAAFDLRKFPQGTNHGDLQAAGRILLYGAIKDSDELNRLVYDFLTAHAQGQPWTRV